LKLIDGVSYNSGATRNDIVDTTELSSFEGEVSADVLSDQLGFVIERAAGNTRTRGVYGCM